MKHLTRADLDALREQLLAREGLLTREVEQSLIDHRKQTRDADNEPGMLDLDAAFADAHRLRDQHEIEGIHAALARMDRGSYGRCLHCGVSIPPERLRAQPDAEHCQVCQRRVESGG